MSANVIPISSKKPKIWKRVERNLYLHIPSGIYYTRKWRSGKGRIFVSTGQKTLGAARTVAEVKRAEFIEGRRPADTRGFRLRDILADVDAELEKDYQAKERSERTRDKDWTFFKTNLPKHFGDVFVADLDESFWETWIREKGRFIGTKLGDYAKYLSICLDHAVRKRYVQRKPTFRNPDPPPRKGKVIYTPEQIKLFWKHADQVLKDMVVLGGENGFRPFEIRKMKWVHVRFFDGAAIIRFDAEDFYSDKSKGREVRAGAQSYEVLKRRYAERDRGSPWVFPSDKSPAKPQTDVQVSRRWRRMLEAAGLAEGIKFHWLRHTFYSRALLEMRLDVTKVSEFGGTSITTLQKHYLKADYLRTAEVSQVMGLDLGGESGKQRRAKSRKRIG